jgi:glycosyltransferase involved in cell wall biosynthesis
VQNAAKYDIGLCLERKGPRNHDLTVSNKMFDYHMAGLAVIATNLPALAEVVQRSGGGLVCRPGDPASLAEAIEALVAAPGRLAELQDHARRFALREGNLETEIEKISVAMREAVDRMRMAA